MNNNNFSEFKSNCKSYWDKESMDWCDRIIMECNKKGCPILNERRAEKVEGIQREV